MLGAATSGESVVHAVLKLCQPQQHGGFSLVVCSGPHAMVCCVRVNTKHHLYSDMCYKG